MTVCGNRSGLVHGDVLVAADDGWALEVGVKDVVDQVIRTDLPRLAVMARMQSCDW